MESKIQIPLGVAVNSGGRGSLDPWPLVEFRSALSPIICTSQALQDTENDQMFGGGHVEALMPFKAPPVETNLMSSVNHACSAKTPVSY